MVNQMVHHGNHLNLIWHWMHKMEEKLDRDSIRNSQYIDQEELLHQMLKMMFKQFGMHRFLFKTKMIRSQKRLLHQCIEVLQQLKTLMGSKVHLIKMDREDIEEQVQAEKGVLWSLLEVTLFSHKEIDSMKMQIALFQKINRNCRHQSWHRKIFQEAR